MQTLTPSKYKARKDVYEFVFSYGLAGQAFQTTDDLSARDCGQVLDMTVNLFLVPPQMVDDLSARGLRHVGYAIDTALFGGFVFRMHQGGLKLHYRQCAR